MSLRGYWRTDSERIDQQPRDQDHEVDDDRQDRPPDEEVGELHQLSSGFGAGLFAGLDLVVHLDGGAVAELEDARGHDLLARPRAGDDGDLVAARAAELHELLPHAAVGRRRSGPSASRDDEDRVAVGRVADRRGRQRDDAARLARARPAPPRTCRAAAAPPGFANVAWTWTLRVASSTTESIARDPPVTRRRPAWPSARHAAPRRPTRTRRPAAAARRSSRRSGRAPAAARSGRRASRYWPRFTWRMPRTPANGARIVLRSIVARISPDPRLGLLVLGAGAVEVGLGDDPLRHEAAHAVEVQRARARAAPRRRRAAPAPAACRAARGPRPPAPRWPDSNVIVSTTPGQVRAHRHAVHGGAPCRWPRASPATAPAAPRSSSPPRAAAGTRRPARSPPGSAGSSRRRGRRPLPTTASASARCACS